MIECVCTNTNHCQKVKTWWIWRLISIIAENKPHAHHMTHFHTMKGFNARPVYSLAIEVFWLKYSLVPKLSTLSSDPIEFVDRPVPEKLDNSASIFPKLSSKNRTWCCDTQQFLSPVSTISVSNAWDPDSPFGAHTSETNYLLCRSMF